jgi:hypothetical protein
LFGEEITNGPLVFARVAIETGRDEVVKTVVPIIGNGFDVI